MTTIATLAEFAYAIRLDPATAAKHQLLLELAEGLVIGELGELESYSTTAKSVVLGAAARAYFNLEGTQQEELSDSVRQPLDVTRLGVYLTDEEIQGLNGSAGRTPQFEFPGYWPYPDPVERATDSVSG